MRHIQFETYREKLRLVWRSREAASALVDIPADGRPHPEDIAALLVKALEVRGPGAGPIEIADEWVERLDCHWHEYAVALDNLLVGIGPPTSGAFNNDYYGECTGGCIRADIWGMLHPGDPLEAAERAAMDATIDHRGVALDVAGFVAALVAEAFVSGDLRSAIRVGMNQLPAGSPAAACVQAVGTALEASGSWRPAWTAVAADWGHPEPTNLLMNVAGVMTALLGGEGDWRRTLDICQATGGDVVAKSLLAATILGALGTGPAAPAKSSRRQTGRKPCLRNTARFSGGDEFVERVLGLAIAAARTGEVEFVGAPYTPAIGPPVARPVRLVARYERDPVLAPGESKAVFLERPQGSDEVGGTLEVEPSPGCVLDQMGGITVPGRISARAVNARLDDSGSTPGVMRARVVRAGRTVAEATFGFHLARKYLALGPFEYVDARSLEQKYLPEARLSENVPQGKTPFHQRPIYASGDAIDVDGAFGSTGPRIVYLVRVVNSPKARKVSLRIGSSDGLRVWLNGRKVHGHDRVGFAHADDFVIPAVFRKGANRLVIKHGRAGAASTLRLRICERDTERALLDMWEAF